MDLILGQKNKSLKPNEDQAQTEASQKASKSYKPKPHTNTRKKSTSTERSQPRAKYSKMSSKGNTRNRYPSSSADDSGCSDSTPPSTRDSGLSINILSPLTQEVDLLPKLFEQGNGNKDNLPIIVDVKGSTQEQHSSNRSRSWGPKRHRPNNPDVVESSGKEEDSIINGLVDLDNLQMGHNNYLQNVSEDEARRPEWQPKVIVSKSLSDSSYETRGLAKLGKSPLSIASSPSSFTMYDLPS